MIGIYKITSPTNRVYIGQSKNIKRRWRDYELNLAKNQRLLNRSFLKYGIENHVFEVVCECLIEELNEKERYYQDLFSALGKKGLNLILTETTTKRRLVSKYFSETLKKRNKERIWSEESRKKIAEHGKKRMIGNTYKKGFKHDEAFKEKRRQIMLGNKNTLGFYQNEETRKKMSENSGRRVVILDTNTGIYYERLEEVAEILNITKKSVLRKLHGYSNRKNNTPYRIV